MTTPATQPAELTYEDLFLAWERAARRHETQVRYHAGKFRVRMIGTEREAVCWDVDLGTAIERALVSIGEIA